MSDPSQKHLQKPGSATTPGNLSHEYIDFVDVKNKKKPNTQISLKHYAKLGAQAFVTMEAMPIVLEECLKVFGGAATYSWGENALMAFPTAVLFATAVPFAAAIARSKGKDSTKAIVVTGLAAALLGYPIRKGIQKNIDEQHHKKEQQNNPVPLYQETSETMLSKNTVSYYSGITSELVLS